MTDNDLIRLRQEAQDTFALLDSQKINKDAFLLAGASVAILDHLVAEDDISPPIPQEHSTDEPVAHSGVLDDFSVILSRYANSRSSADRDAMRKTLKAQLDAILNELVEMRHEIHDEIAVQLFIDFREAVRLQI